MIALIIAASIASTRTAAPAERCVPQGPEYVATDKQGTARKLGELPPAKHYLTLHRAVNGCPKPVIVRSGIGAVQR